MIECKGLGKRFTNKWVLKELNFFIPKGSFLCIFGPNGVGKTTLIKLLTGFIPPTKGSIVFFGEPWEKSQLVKRQVGCVTHEPFLFSHLTVQENLHFWGTLYEVSSLRARIASLADQFSLRSYLSEGVTTLSAGVVKRVNLVRALLHDPQVLFLDEPFGYLDLQSTEVLEKQLRELHRSGKMIILATHHLLQGLGLCDRVMVLKNQGIWLEKRRSELNLVEFENTYRTLWSAPSVN